MSDSRSIQDLVLDDVVAAIRHGRFVLAHAAIEGHEEVLRYLLHRITCSVAVGTSSPDPSKLVEELSAAVLGAAEEGHAHCLSALLEACAPLISIDDLTQATTHHQRTALMLAAAGGSSACVATLLQHNPEAQVEAMDDEGGTALLLASEYGHAECVGLLLQHSPATQMLADAGLLTPLMMAAQGGHGECVRLLLQHSPEAQVAAVSEGEETALLMATGNGHADCVSQLLQHSPDAQLAAVNEIGDTPLVSAARYGQAECVRLLLQYSPEAQVLHVPQGGDSALTAAVRNNHPDCVALLLAHVPSAQIATEDDVGRTAVETAARWGHIQCLDLLLAHDTQLQHLDAAWLATLRAWDASEPRTSPHAQCLERLHAKGALLPASALEPDRAKSRLFIQEVGSRALVADRVDEAVQGLALSARGKKRKAGQREEA